MDKKTVKSAINREFGHSFLIALNNTMWNTRVQIGAIPAKEYKREAAACAYFLLWLSPSSP